MISENDSSGGEDEVPLEVSNETARKETLESVRLQCEAVCKSKKRRPRKRVEIPVNISNDGEDGESDISDEPSDAIVNQVNSNATAKPTDQRVNHIDELMTDDESSQSNISEVENDRIHHSIDHVDDETTVETNEDDSRFSSEVTESKSKSNRQRKGTSVRKSVPVQYKNGTNISSVNENSSSSIESLIGSTSRSSFGGGGRKKFTIRRADKANRVANRSLYRKAGAALALNFKERMLYSTTRIARINASTLLANRERRNHI